jgi:hypothetical protein
MTMNIYDFFDQMVYLNSEVYIDECHTCESPQNTNKKTKILALPNVLVIGFRDIYQINTQVPEFELSYDLDLTSYIIDKEAIKVYKLSSFITWEYGPFGFKTLATYIVSYDSVTGHPLSLRRITKFDISIVSIAELTRVISPKILVYTMVKTESSLMRNIQSILEVRNSIHCDRGDYLPVPNFWIEKLLAFGEVSDLGTDYLFCAEHDNLIPSYFDIYPPNLSDKHFRSVVTMQEMAALKHSDFCRIEKALARDSHGLKYGQLLMSCTFLPEPVTNAILEKFEYSNDIQQAYDSLMHRDSICQTCNTDAKALRIRRLIERYFVLKCELFIQSLG